MQIFYLEIQSQKDNGYKNKPKTFMKNKLNKKISYAIYIRAPHFSFHSSKRHRRTQNKNIIVT